MKNKLFILFLILFCSCKDNPNDSRYKNSDYVFYEENGKKGYWQKISKDSDFKYKKGILKYYYDNGNRFGEIEILDSLPNRVEKLFDKETDSLIKTVWKKNSEEYERIYENGYYKHFYSNKGKIVIEEGLVEDNLEQGLWKRYWNTDGSIKQTINLKDGKNHGERVNYRRNGNRKDLSNWDMGKQIGRAIFYYENGKIEEENHTKDGKFHGSMIKYFKNTNVESERKYWKGELIDTCKTYYENGQLKLLQFFDLDTISMKKSGSQINYYPSGKIEAEITFNDNIANLKRYYESGELEELSTKINGKHDGEVIAYYQNGNKKIVGIASKGYYNGKFQFFNKSGKLEKTVNYDLGDPLDSIMH